MLTFQLIVIPLLCFAAFMETRAVFHSTLGKRYHAVRLLIWLAAIVAVGLPDLTGLIAQKVGITRGADLVIYVFMLFSLAAMFRLYTRQFILQQKIAELTRFHALQDPQQRDTVSSPPIPEQPLQLSGDSTGPSGDV